MSGESGDGKIVYDSQISDEPNENERLFDLYLSPSMFSKASNADKIARRKTMNRTSIDESRVDAVRQLFTKGGCFYVIMCIFFFVFVLIAPLWIPLVIIFLLWFTTSYILCGDVWSEHSNSKTLFDLSMIYLVFICVLYPFFSFFYLLMMPCSICCCLICRSVREIESMSDEERSRKGYIGLNYQN